jgi:AhpD family alkylhydroperoxidase
MFIRKEIEELYDKFSAAVSNPGALDGKIKELIALSVSVMADCVPCIEYHYKGAIRAGASKEEIAESIAIAMSVCAGSKKAKYSGLIATLEKE